MASTSFGEYISLYSIQDMELLAHEHNCVLWIRNKKYDKQLYVSNTYESLWGRSCLTLYEDPMSWNDTLNEEDTQNFIKNLLSKRLLINPHYTAMFCVKMPNGGLRWFQDRSFHLPVSGENQTIIVGCALHIENKNEIIANQNNTSDKLDYIIAQFYRILSHHIPEQNSALEPKEHALLATLSKREKEILKLFLNGYTATQVAESVCLSRRTIESYLINLKNKLNCGSKSEMIIKAIENQWILINIS